MCVCVCVYMFLFARVWVWIVKTLWLVLFRMALYCCIFYFATKCIKHEIYCEPFYDFLLQSTWLLFGVGGIELGELRGTRPFHFEKLLLLPIEQIVFLTFLFFWGCIIWGQINKSFAATLTTTYFICHEFSSLSLLSVFFSCASICRMIIKLFAVSWRINAQLLRAI